MTKKKEKEQWTPQKICEGLDVRIRPQAEILAAQLIALGEKIEEAQAQIPDEDLVIPYDNGGGQSGIRQNPFWDSYQKLLLMYRKSLSQLAEMIEGTRPEAESSLDAFRARFHLSQFSMHGQDGEFGKRKKDA